MPTKKILQYALVITIVLLTAGLAGWYVLLDRQGQAIIATDTGRGLDSAPPTFGDSAGSTYSNVSGGDASSAGRDPSKPPPRLWLVAKNPVAGMGFVEIPKENRASSATTSSHLYFAERGTGNILKADPVTGSITRLTNTLFPRVYEAVFGSDGAVVLRSVDDGGNVTSFAGEAPGHALSDTSSQLIKATVSTDATTLSGNFLERNILSLVPKRGVHELLLLVSTFDGGSSVISSSWDGIKQKTLFTSPLSNWKLFSLPDGRIFLSLLPSDDVAGIAYELKNGSLVERVRNIRGLTFLPRSSSSAVLFGQSGVDDVSLLYSPDVGSGAEYLPIRTVADKCVWAEPPSPASSGNKAKLMGAGSLIAYCAVPQTFSSQTFLADWYRGVVHTSDSWWRIDVGTGQVTPLLQSGETAIIFDVENPMIDQAGENIAFMDARDKSLWLLRVNSQE